MTNEQRNKHVQGIVDALAGQQPTRRGAIPAPAIINDMAADPALRRATLKQYASAVLETPSSDWTAEMKAAVAEECRNVARESGY